MAAHPLILALREARRRRRLSQGDVADRAGYAEHSINRWEKGARTPTIDAVTDWANALGYDLTLTHREGR